MFARRYIHIFVILASATSWSCPTCVGKITHDSPPFFSDECYEWCDDAHKKSEESKADLTINLKKETPS